MRLGAARRTVENALSSLLWVGLLVGAVIIGR
jgi:hypothetical protein